AVSESRHQRGKRCLPRHKIHAGGFGAGGPCPLLLGVRAPSPPTGGSYTEAAVTGEASGFRCDGLRVGGGEAGRGRADRAGGGGGGVAGRAGAGGGGGGRGGGGPGRAGGGGLGGAEAEEEAVGGDSGGTGDEHRHAGRGGRDRLQEAGAVEAADGAEQLPRGHGFARADGRLPPAFVLAAQPQETLEVGGLVIRASLGQRGALRRAGHGERGEDAVEPADVRVD